MKTIWPRIVLTSTAALFAAWTVHAAEVHGTVINRTEGKPAPNIGLTLLNPTAGMTEVGSGKSDARGQFTVSTKAIQAGPILIRAIYHDVSFNTFLPPGQTQIDVDVYEISKDVKTIAVPSHVIIFQPHGDKLVGMDEYYVQNESLPPYAYFRAEGSFDFAIPENGKLGRVTTTTRMGMSVDQASIDKGKAHYAIAYAFRPGETIVRFSYQLPYTDDSAVVNLPVTYAGSKLFVVVPTGVTVIGDGLTAQRQVQGMTVYIHDPVPVNGVLSVSLSGASSLQGTDIGGGEGRGPAQEGNFRTEGRGVQVVPSRLEDFKWYLFDGLGALFLMGWILLSRKRVVSPAEEKGAVARTGANVAEPEKAHLQTQSAASMASVEKQTCATLESLKDQMFRLELRRQAGMMLDEEYAREKARVEKWR